MKAATQNIKPTSLTLQSKALHLQVHESEFSTWPLSRQRAWNRRFVSPERYFYKFLPPNHDQERVKFHLLQHHRAFLSALKRLPPPCDWGTFSLLVKGQVGAQCRRYFQLLRNAGLVSQTGVSCLPKNILKVGKSISKNGVFLKRGLRKFVIEQGKDELFENVDDSLLESFKDISNRNNRITVVTRKSKKKRRCGLNEGKEKRQLLKIMNEKHNQHRCDGQEYENIILSNSVVSDDDTMSGKNGSTISLSTCTTRDGLDLESLSSPSTKNRTWTTEEQSGSISQTPRKSKESSLDDDTLSLCSVEQSEDNDEEHRSRTNRKSSFWTETILKLFCDEVATCKRRRHHWIERCALLQRVERCVVTGEDAMEKRCGQFIQEMNEMERRQNQEWSVQHMLDQVI